MQLVRIFRKDNVQGGRDQYKIPRDFSPAIFKKFQMYQ